MSGNFNSRSILGLRFVVFLFVTSILVPTSEGLNSEGHYLLELKESLLDQLNHLGNWNRTDHTPCGWNGVHCSDGNDPVVYLLVLNSKNLSGVLSPSIGGLVHLKELDLGHNGLTGEIPGEIGNCSVLESLYLNDNKFVGQIPVELGKLSYLIRLNICNNRISGPIPEEFGNLSALVDFVAYTNNLTGL
jgi:Leucine-rich repeat (LRR) protein